MLFEELDEIFAWNSTVLRTRNAISLQPPESNHLLTVRGATLQIFATCPVVNTFICRISVSLRNFISYTHFGEKRI